MRITDALQALLPVAVATSFALTWCTEARASASKDTVSHIINTLASTQNTATVSRQLSGLIDFSRIAQLAFTPDQWTQFSHRDQKEIVNSFRQLIEKRYYPRWHKLFARSTVEVADEASSQGSNFVRTYITHGKEKDSVIWRLQDNHGQPAIVDLNVNSKGLDARLSERVQARLTKQGSRKFVSWLKEEASQSDGGETEGASNTTM